ncbi:DUF364 domain-containing protein [Thermosipho ferrireducens]|uniref:DUF364 domain-containing protein n=1 Tax=Thermosipho ferrireducens TaxID=2571116 RepID=A0ABX7S5E5_9BACT|nr:DUF364 domain-containing protein [Thermosipho ferrireducens]QTA37751.1 DUF364 domain-containing protein [Thermosipho ferrireducens]
MSTISEKLLKKAQEYLENETIEDFIVGIGITAVKLSDGRTGIGFTNKQDTLGRCEEFYKCTGVEGNPQSKVEVGMKAIDLLKIGLFSGDPLLRSVAYACVNAVFSVEEIEKHYIKGDISEYLSVTMDDIVGMVGEITPLVTSWKMKVWDLLIFDRNRKDDTVFPDWAIVDLLPKCNVVVITGSSVVNGTIDWVLNYVKTDRVAIVGPSTPLVHGVFPVKILAGMKVVDSEKVFKLIARGAGTKKLVAEKAIEKVNLISEF